MAKGRKAVPAQVKAKRGTLRPAREKAAAVPKVPEQLAAKQTQTPRKRSPKMKITVPAKERVQQTSDSDLSGLVIPTPYPLCEGPEHRYIWTKVCTYLAFNKMLSGVSLDLLEQYVVYTVKWKKAQTALDKEGSVLIDLNGKSYKNPWENIANDAQAKLLAIAREFGLTPSTSRIFSLKQEADPDDDFIKKLEK